MWGVESLAPKILPEVLENRKVFGSRVTRCINSKHQDGNRRYSLLVASQLDVSPMLTRRTRRAFNISAANQL